MIPILNSSDRFYNEFTGELENEGDYLPSKQDMIFLLERIASLSVCEIPGDELNHEWLSKLRLALGTECSINELYCGQGITLRGEGNAGPYQIGAREMMVKHAGTGIPLTEENAKVVPLGRYTKEEATHYFDTALKR